MRSIAACLLLLVFSQLASAQLAESPIPRTILKNSPVHFAISSLKIGVENFNKLHTKSLSIFIIVQVEDYGLESEGHNGLAGELQYRKYIAPMKEYFTKRNKKFYQGIYAGGYAQGGAYAGKFKYQSTRNPVYDYDYSEKIINWSAGVTLGYHRTFLEVIFIDAYIGGGMQWSQNEISGPLIPGYAYFPSDIGGLTYSGIMPKFGVLIGVGL